MSSVSLSRTPLSLHIVQPEFEPSQQWTCWSKRHIGISERSERWWKSGLGSLCHAWGHSNFSESIGVVFSRLSRVFNRRNDCIILFCDASGHSDPSRLSPPNVLENPDALAREGYTDVLNGGGYTTQLESVCRACAATTTTSHFDWPGKKYRFWFLPVMLPRKSEEEVVWMVPSVGLAPKIYLSFQLISTWGPSTLK